VSAPTPTRDHLFVSFAPADWALAEWLTLRLTREGYRAWCSRFPVLDGERYPSQSDETITMRTCYVLALVSRASLSNPKTMKDMTLAVELGRRRREELLIPLVIDAIDATELDVATGGSAPIPFRERWETGCSALLTKLESVGAPRPLADGDRVASEARQFLASRRSWHTVL
jgi:hypothetical protein